jgi:hypothetical protein
MAQFSRSELILSNDTSFDSSSGSETAASDGKHIARHNTVPLHQLPKFKTCYA